ncbi:MAG: hypothetical protein CMQ17_03445 [Gammaproteobacteria bacterium]|nr:hypothetical protein [Gammaproteobacteria bacterium]
MPGERQFQGLTDFLHGLLELWIQWKNQLDSRQPAKNPIQLLWVGFFIDCTPTAKLYTKPIGNAGFFSDNYLLITCCYAINLTT